MSFLIPLFSTLAGTFLPKALNWIGKKIDGSSLGQASSHLMRKNPRFERNLTDLRDNVI